VNRVQIPTVLVVIKGGEAVVAVGIATKEIARGPMSSKLLIFHICMYYQFKFSVDYLCTVNLVKETMIGMKHGDLLRPTIPSWSATYLCTSLKMRYLITL